MLSCQIITNKKVDEHGSGSASGVELKSERTTWRTTGQILRRVHKAALDTTKNR